MILDYPMKIKIVNSLFFVFFNSQEQDISVQIISDRVL